MGMHAPRRRGRPVVADRARIDEATAELVLEHGFDAVRAEDIARRAGVARSSFFNRVPSKAELLWWGVDARLEEAAEALNGVARGRDASVNGQAGDADPQRSGAQLPPHPGKPTLADAVAAIRSVLLDIARRITPDDIPWAVMYRDSAGLREALIERAAQREQALVAMIQGALAAEVPPGGSSIHLRYRVAARAIAGAVIEATLAWVDAGPGRAGLDSYVGAALDALG